MKTANQISKNDQIKALAPFVENNSNNSISEENLKKANEKPEDFILWAFGMTKRVEEEILDPIKLCVAKLNFANNIYKDFFC